MLKEKQLLISIRCREVQIAFVWRRCLLENCNRRVTKISATTAALLAEASISAVRLDRTFERWIAQRQRARMNKRDHHIRKLRDRTGMPVHYMCRQNLTILLEAQWVFQKRIYCYREESQKNCYLEIPVSVPESVIQTVIGRKLGEIAQGYGYLENAIIERIDEDFSHSRVYFKQSWIPVDQI